MSEVPPYDSRADIQDHMHQVRDRLDACVMELLRRGRAHDASKLSDAEKPAFDMVMPLLPGVTYGSPEFSALEARLGPALAHHYQHNTHHPEHYGNRGIAGMDIFDVIEMICDWIASAARQPNGHVNLAHNTKRFGIDSQLASILANTLERWPSVDETGRATARPKSGNDMAE